jgi:hypothetical protein
MVVEGVSLIAIRTRTVALDRVVVSSEGIVLIKATVLIRAVVLREIVAQNEIIVLDKRCAVTTKVDVMRLPSAAQEVVQQVPTAKIQPALRAVLTTNVPDKNVLATMKVLVANAGLGLKGSLVTLKSEALGIARKVAFKVVPQVVAVQDQLGETQIGRTGLNLASGNQRLEKVVELANSPFAVGKSEEVSSQQVHVHRQLIISLLPLKQGRRSTS